MGKNMTAFTLKEVKAWVDKYDGIAGALRWFEAYASNNAFYQKIAKPLLSIRTTGPIDVERAIKPIKGCVLTKQRNKIADGKAVVLFRLSENLKQLHNFKVEFKKGSLSAGGAGSIRLPQGIVCKDLMDKVEISDDSESSVGE